VCSGQLCLTSALLAALLYIGLNAVFMFIILFFTLNKRNSLSVSDLSLLLKLTLSRRLLHGVLLLELFQSVTVPHAS